jgi:hypothetical protein
MQKVTQAADVEQRLLHGWDEEIGPPTVLKKLRHVGPKLAMTVLRHLLRFAGYL